MSIKSKIRSLGGKLMRCGMRLIPTSRHYIMFESELDFAESARAIYDYMIRHGMNNKYHLIWSVKDPSLYPPQKNVVFIRRNKNSLRWNFYLNRCKYFIFTHPWWLTSWKTGQVVINTGHGTLPLKAGAFHKEPIFQIVLSGSPLTEKIKKLYWGSGFQYQVVPLDLPRNDWLFERGNFLKPFLDGKENQHFILCMPTFKQAAGWIDSEERNPYFINVVNCREDMERLNSFLAANHTLLVCKLHHLQTLDYFTTERYSNILYLRDEQLQKYDVMINHVLTCADALVTDFSSVCFDFMLLDRPLGFFTNTTGQYTRGYLMNDPESYMAGRRIETLEDFMRFITDVLAGKDEYKEMRNAVKEKCFRYLDANNCKRFLEHFHIN